MQSFQNEIVTEVNPHFAPLYDKKNPYRYFVFYGGRGGGKSESIAQFLILETMQYKKNVLCIREKQNSMVESVMSLLLKWIYFLKAKHLFEIKEISIKNKKTGSRFIFRGMQNHTKENIKSLNDIDICWCEEAHSLSDESLATLKPTVRNSGSYFIFSFNPSHKNDAVYKEFVKNKQNDDTFLLKINYYDNPFISDVLLAEVERDKQIHSIARNAHVWEGELRDDSLAIFKKEWLLFTDIDDMKFINYYIVCDTAYKDGKKHDYTAFGYFGVTEDKKGCLIDLETFKAEYPEMKGRLMAFINKHNKYPFPSVHIEDKASGITLIQELNNRDYHIHPIVRNTKSKIERANQVVPKIATDKLMVKEGIKNTDLLIEQFTRFSNDTKSEVHDDIVDIIVDFFAIIHKNRTSADRMEEIFYNE